MKCIPRQQIVQLIKQTPALFQLLVENDYKKLREEIVKSKYQCVSRDALELLRDDRRVEHGKVVPVTPAVEVPTNVFVGQQDDEMSIKSGATGGIENNFLEREAEWRASQPLPVDISSSMHRDCEKQQATIGRTDQHPGAMPAQSLHDG